MDNGQLSLRSLTVEGYRGIRSLTLPELGRVNLFVGKNNAGKTSLLEAIDLFVQRNGRALPAVLLDVIRTHADLVPGPADADWKAGSALSDTVEAVEGLFAGFDSKDPVREIQFRAGTGSDRLIITVDWASDFDSDINADEPRPVLVDPAATELVLESETRRATLPLDWLDRRVYVPGSEDRALSFTVPAAGLDASVARDMWDRLALTGEDEMVEDAVRLLVPGLERIAVVGEQRRRTVMCRIQGSSRPVPLASLGDGANRVFGLAVALVTRRGGALLIDEIENGLHHAVQCEVWNFLFQLAQRLDVQVFATTHSWDAVVGFQYAANQSPALGMLYRLNREADGSIRPTRYTEEDVAIAAEQLIEVR